MMTTAVNNSPAELVAIIRAARLAGDRELERTAKRELHARFGITLKFQKPKRAGRTAVAQ